MTDLLNAALIEEIISLFAQAVFCGLALSCITTALSWAIVTILRLVHKFF